MIRVVLGTNVIVSAQLARGGAEAHTLDLATSGKIHMYVSEAILAEYCEVLRRGKFVRLGPGVIENALILIRRKSTKVYPAEKLQISPDESDNRFLECAVAADADYLVTGNKRHFPA